LGLWLGAKKTPYLWPIRLTIIALISLHIFTPYLNHPLGISLILAMAILEMHFGKGLPRKAISSLKRVAASLGKVFIFGKS
jgi:hypothetical protein